MLTGGCFRDYVRYRVAGTVRDQTNCRCSICRRGAPFVARFTVAETEFAIIGVAAASFRSSEHARRESSLPLAFDSTHAPGLADIATCKPDDAEAVHRTITRPRAASLHGSVPPTACCATPWRAGETPA